MHSVSLVQFYACVCLSRTEAERERGGEGEEGRTEGDANDDVPSLRCSLSLFSLFFLARADYERYLITTECV